MQVFYFLIQLFRSYIYFCVFCLQKPGEVAQHDLLLLLRQTQSCFRYKSFCISSTVSDFLLSFSFSASFEQRAHPTLSCCHYALSIFPPGPSFLTGLGVSQDGDLFGCRIRVSGQSTCSSTRPTNFHALFPRHSMG